MGTVTDPKPVTLPVIPGLEEEEIAAGEVPPDVVMRQLALDHAVQINLRYGESMDSNGRRIPPNVWDILAQADHYFNFLKNGTHTP